MMTDDSLPTPGVDSATDTPNIKPHQRARPTGTFPTGTDCHRDYNYLDTTQHLQTNFSVFIHRGHHQRNVPGPTDCSFSSLPSFLFFPSSWQPSSECPRANRLLFLLTSINPTPQIYWRGERPCFPRAGQLSLPTMWFIPTYLRRTEGFSLPRAVTIVTRPNDLIDLSLHESWPWLAFGIGNWKGVTVLVFISSSCSYRMKRFRTEYDSPYF